MFLSGTPSSWERSPASTTESPPLALMPLRRHLNGARPLRRTECIDVFVLSFEPPHWLCCSKLLRLCDCCASAQPRWWHRFGTAVCLAWIDEFFFDIHTYRQYFAGKKIKGVLLAALIFITNHRGMLIYYQWGMLLYCGVYTKHEKQPILNFSRERNKVYVYYRETWGKTEKTLPFIYCN